MLARSNLGRLSGLGREAWRRENLEVETLDGKVIWRWKATAQRDQSRLLEVLGRLLQDAGLTGQ